MKKNFILRVRISSEDLETLNRTVDHLNENKAVEFSQSDIVRLALRSFSKEVLARGLRLDF